MGVREDGDTRWNATPGRVQSERRRERVLTVVEHRELPLSLPELAEAVADRTDESALDDPETVRLRLHHVDLPKLQECDVLEYDPSRNVVSEYFENESS